MNKTRSRHERNYTTLSNFIYFFNTKNWFQKLGKWTVEMVQAECSGLCGPSSSCMSLVTRSFLVPLLGWLGVERRGHFLIVSERGTENAEGDSKGACVEGLGRAVLERVAVTRVTHSSFFY